MKTKKNRNKTYAIIFHEDALLFCRGLGENTWSLPADVHDVNLRNSLQKVHGFEIEDARRLPIFHTKIQGKKQKIELYLFSLSGKPIEDGTEWAYFEEFSAALQNIDPVMGLVAKRAFIYAPLYLRQERTVPLLEPEQKIVEWEIGALKFFRRYIPRGERKQFKALTEMASSVRRMNYAFKALCQTYRVDPKLYNEHLAYLQRKKKVEAHK